MSKYVDVEPIIQYAQEQMTAVFAYPQSARKEDERAERKAWGVVRDYLVNTQEADVAIVKHGRWEWRGHYLVCSICGKDNDRYNYCPNCGAKMDEVEE